jgi:hypothetical protein
MRRKCVAHGSPRRNQTGRTPYLKSDREKALLLKNFWKQARTVIAVEKDDRAIPFLSEKFAQKLQKGN